MEKRFLIKTGIIFLLSFLFFFLKLNVNSAKAFCENQLETVKVQNNLSQMEINSFEVFPFDDFLIRI
jgi:hypothetical protein